MLSPPFLITNCKGYIDFGALGFEYLRPKVGNNLIKKFDRFDWQFRGGIGLYA